MQSKLHPCTCPHPVPSTLGTKSRIPILFPQVQHPLLLLPPEPWISGPEGSGHFSHLREVHVHLLYCLGSNDVHKLWLTAPLCFICAVMCLQPFMCGLSKGHSALSVTSVYLPRIHRLFQPAASSTSFSTLPPIPNSPSLINHQGLPAPPPKSPSLHPSPPH